MCGSGLAADTKIVDLINLNGDDLDDDDDDDHRRSASTSFWTWYKTGGGSFYLSFLSISLSGSGCSLFYTGSMAVPDGRCM